MIVFSVGGDENCAFLPAGAEFAKQVTDQDRLVPWAGAADMTSAYRKLNFINGNVDRWTTSPNRIEVFAALPSALSKQLLRRDRWMVA